MRVTIENHTENMNRILILFCLLLIVLSCSEKSSDPSKVKSLLMTQLKNTHSNQEWFVPMKTAVEGLTFEQSNWKDSTENHSIAELVSHIVFWNEMNLKAFQGEDMSNFEIDNDTTFKKFNDKEWKSTLKKLDSVQTEWEQLTEKATAEQIDQWSSEIANMTAHNAYHTGQIIYIRKRNGWWNKK